MSSSSSAPRTKPWEVASGTSAASTQQPTPLSTTTAATTATTATTGSGSASVNPHIPDRPTSLTSDFNNMAETSPYGTSTTYGNRYGTSSYGTGLYGGGGYGSSMYGGGYGSSMYGGGYGSLYGGGYGSGMYGGGYGSGMYGGGYGSGMYGNNPTTMQGGFGESTQATFHLIESIIGAVGGFAQMLEATYMATHSSFFTMVNLAEQFGNLKNALGSLLGIFALIKFVKKIFSKLTGSDYNNGLNLGEFIKYEKQQKKIEDQVKKSRNPNKRISLKPLLLFLVASIGFPYILSKAIQMLNEQNRRKQMEMQQQQQQQQQQHNPSPFDPSNLQFAKAIYEFNPENPQIEIPLKPNDLVAILSRKDPMGQESKWWKVRSRSGQVGYVPSNYLTVIERKQQEQIQPPPPPQSSSLQKSESTPIINTKKEWDGKPDKLVEEFRNFS
ncbi:PEX13 [Candida oxycetoniae]|uniref:Peroxisomal membrane protein PEX13 n=1 Tax=Candida oxycetoniae TaxID=497107 RepID=A0AAI9X062_9ASCO|nr:PEX13 [Candida oxycetoniae]KAI3406923.2 PEX13 [Candida oxycetoniae]